LKEFELLFFYPKDRVGAVAGQHPGVVRQRYQFLLNALDKLPKVLRPPGLAWPVREERVSRKKDVPPQKAEALWRVAGRVQHLQ
jgi:hypothetical protein